MATLFLVCGIPGSGKSTFLSNFVKSPNSLIISRDKIRFSLLREGEKYFSHESVVKQMFYSGITKALQLGYNVFADQSSINPTFRKEILNNVRGYKEANIIWINTPIEICIKRDSKRHGRERVGEKVIKNMYSHFVPPTFKEKFSHIYHYSNGILIEQKKGQINIK